MAWPQRETAQRRGCTCQWLGSGHIVEFDPNCPLSTEHRPFAPTKASKENERVALIDRAIDRLIGGRQLWSVVGMDAANQANEARATQLRAERDRYKTALETIRDDHDSWQHPAARHRSVAREALRSAAEPSGAHAQGNPPRSAWQPPATDN